jgi:hypothetical protein
MAAKAHARRNVDGTAANTEANSSPAPDEIKLEEHPLKLSKNDGPGWYTFDRPLLYMYAGQGPYVARYVHIVRDNILG